MQKRELNPRQLAFVNQYIVDRNGAAAARRAGYANPAVAASRMLTKDNIRAEIDRRISKVEQKADISAERVLKEYARIAFLNPQDLYDANGRLLNVKDMPEDAARAIAGLEEEVIYGSDGEGGKSEIGRLKKIRLAGKIPALEGLARHLGMFAEERTLAQAFQIVIHVGREE
jgi:phage terminase small subunit